MRKYGVQGVVEGVVVQVVADVDRRPDGLEAGEVKGKEQGIKGKGVRLSATSVGAGRHAKCCRVRFPCVIRDSMLPGLDVDYRKRGRGVKGVEAGWYGRA